MNWWKKKMWPTFSIRAPFDCLRHNVWVGGGEPHVFVIVAGNVGDNIQEM